MGGDFAGVCAGFLKVHVLGADADAGGLQGFGDGLEGDKGGTDDAVYLVGQVVKVVAYFADEFDGFGRCFVHFPVAGDDGFSHLIPPGVGNW
jgi:hypothetical protein